ncbi:CopD family protein [Pokkaliibacter sp. MBI-7]|uniref:CopD family protein n=1 Tax=Pokkaliibacter sp. MBI-7 TaxID=3040600 RepID=UPI002449A8EA|nr:CopD family protein [Pokkaliibacter sp. MBI-7]MDH2434028.1 CopD family protein [Pokkaliibacter sp. MBI-7]
MMLGTLSGWEVLTLLSKLGSYGAMAALAGALFMRNCLYSAEVEPWLRRYLWVGCGGTLVMTLLSFLIQVGALAEDGVAGMFDASLAGMLWSSGNGTTAWLRLLAAVVVLISRRHLHHAGQYRWLAGVAGTLIAASFASSGHMATEGGLAALTVALHALTALIWMGSLLPLWQHLQLTKPHHAAAVLTRFGELAGYLVALLLLAGVFMLWRISGGHWQGLVDSVYGQSILLKLLLVSGLLLLAALNRWQLVPALPASSRALDLSLKVEKLLGLAVLLVTVLLTTLMGPEG